MSEPSAEMWRGAVMLDLSDPAERFMRGVIDRFHQDPGLYRMLTLRRAEVSLGGRAVRVLLEVACFCPARAGARPEWLLISWGIDEVDVRMERCMSPSDAFARLEMRVNAGRPEPGRAVP